MKKVAISYKGKHFIICDKDTVDEFDIILNYIDVEKVIKENLESHVADCAYYGIPAYLGDDVELQARILKIQNKNK